METVKMITTVPLELAEQLANHKRVIGYNTLPQVTPKVINVIKDFFRVNIGYEDSPIACLSKVHQRDVSIRESADVLKNFIPTKAQETIMFELKMPADSVVSIEFQDLLAYTEELEDALDDEDAEFIASELKSALVIGSPDQLNNAISFIPFLDFKRCDYFATLDSSFKSSEINLEGIQKIDLRELRRFD